MTDHND